MGSPGVILAGYDGLQIPVAHACGHDMHMSCLRTGTEALTTAALAWLARK